MLLVEQNLDLVLALTGRVPVHRERPHRRASRRLRCCATTLRCSIATSRSDDVMAQARRPRPRCDQLHARAAAGDARAGHHLRPDERDQHGARRAVPARRLYRGAGASAQGGSFWLALLLAPLVLAVVGLVVEELVIRHVYHRFIDTILATWGLSLVIKQAVIVAFGPDRAAGRANPLPAAGARSLGATYPVYRLFIMAVAVAVARRHLPALLPHASSGWRRARVIANRPMAAASASTRARMDRLTFAFGAALAGLAGAVMAPLMSVDPQMGVGFLDAGLPVDPGRRRRQPARRAARHLADRRRPAPCVLERLDARSWPRSWCSPGHRGHPPVPAGADRRPALTCRRGTSASALTVSVWAVLALLPLVVERVEA